MPSTRCSRLTELRGALIDGAYRRDLYRIWDERLPLLLWVGLNPSTADAAVDDATIRKERGFTKNLWWNDSWFGGFAKVNLFDFRATDSDKLRGWRNMWWNDWTSRATRQHDVGKDINLSLKNDSAIMKWCFDPRVSAIMVAWGALHVELEWRLTAVEAIVRSAAKPILCLGRTKGGQPRHPVRLPYATKVEVWK